MNPEVWVLSVIWLEVVFNFLWSGIWTMVALRFFVPILTSPKAYCASYTLGTQSLLWW